MNLLPYIRSVLEHDRASIVICNLQHEIIYMNPAAVERYKKHGDLLGKSLLDCHNARSNELIKRTIEWFSADQSHNILYTHHNDKENKDVYMVALRDEQGTLIGYYEKHEYRDRETAKPYAFK